MRKASPVFRKEGGSAAKLEDAKDNRQGPSIPVVFAVDDVRGGNIKRAASPIGEGSIAVAFVHQVLAE